MSAYQERALEARRVRMEKEEQRIANAKKGGDAKAALARAPEPEVGTNERALYLS